MNTLFLDIALKIRLHCSLVIAIVIFYIQSTNNRNIVKQYARVNVIIHHLTIWILEVKMTIITNVRATGKLELK